MAEQLDQMTPALHRVILALKCCFHKYSIRLQEQLFPCLLQQLSLMSKKMFFVFLMFLLSYFLEVANMLSDVG